MNDMADELAELSWDTREREQVRRHRYREARRLGMSIVEATEFADTTADLADLRRLIEAGCALQLARRIVQ